MGDAVLTCSSAPQLGRLKQHCCVFITIAVAGCASISTLSCPSGEQPVVLDSLYFGTAKPSGIVTAEEWAAFLDETVVRSFPEGLTSWAATGRWGNAAGLTEREQSYLLQLAHDGSQEKDRAVQQVVQRYKRQFQQEAVMRIRSQACRSF
ncbi:MAG: DUF3574 domain-containing protein [Nitrospira sp.]|nr:DUF3574 domain-containing protein [Nitrospira sp.]